jgi:hypothetical protein
MLSSVKSGDKVCTIYSDIERNANSAHALYLYAQIKGQIGRTIPGRAVKGHKVVRRRGSKMMLENRLTDGSEFVNLTRRSPFTPG